MKVFKVNMDVWVRGNNKQEAVDNLVGDMDYLLEMENEYVHVMSFVRLTAPVLDKEVTQQFKGEQA
jgi:hypothetical protein